MIPSIIYSFEIVNRSLSFDCILFQIAVCKTHVINYQFFLRLNWNLYGNVGDGVLSNFLLKTWQIEALWELWCLMQLKLDGVSLQRPSQRMQRRRVQHGYSCGASVLFCFNFFSRISYTSDAFLNSSSSHGPSVMIRSDASEPSQPRSIIKSAWGPCL